MRDEIEEMGLHRPGILFEVNDDRFMTKGSIGANGLYVTRLENAKPDTLDIPLLYDDYQDGKLHILRTHQHDSQVPLDRKTLATLVDEVTQNVALLSGEYQADVQDALRTAREVLD